VAGCAARRASSIRSARCRGTLSCAHRAQPLTPGEVYRFDIEVRPYGILMRPGSRLALRIKCADDEKPQTALQAIALGHIARPDSARVTVHHDADHPSCLLLPTTRGNRIETYISGGIPLKP
jgi:predicted acyl esterase